MTIKPWLKLTFCGFCIAFLSLPAAEAFNRKDPTAKDYLEPQFIEPIKDRTFLQSIGMDGGLENQPILNIMLLAQDKRGPKARAALTTIDDTKTVVKGLASRSDIINIISLNRNTGQWTIFSFYRGMRTPESCGGSLRDEENYLTNYYSAYQRRYMIPCLEHIVRSAISRRPHLATIYGANAADFKIHGFIEGTKEETLNGLAASMASIAFWNSITLTSIYGRAGFSSALSMIMNRNESSKLMNEQNPTGSVKVDTGYLYIEAKEREIYPAGGYQRAFNFARLLADALGWMGYGVYYRPDITDIFAETFNKHFSRTFKWKDFVSATSLTNGTSALAGAAYRNGMSPVTVVQFGPRIDVYSVFQNNQFEHFGERTQLTHLDPKIQILKPPPSLSN